MIREPILRDGRYVEGGFKFRIRVLGGLHRIGAQDPYFTLTAQIDRQAKNNRWMDWGGGACHDTILAHYPDLADLAAMHLSTIDGSPMHAVANGWYWYKGGLYLGEKWLAAEVRYGQPVTLDEQAGVLASHARISEAEARDLIAQNLNKEDFERWIDEQRPRWKAEAEACITKHGLRVFES